MNTTSLTIKNATAILGDARGGINDMGEPRLVLDADDGERVYATFASSIYADPAAHYRAFAGHAAMSLDRPSMARLAVAMLSILPAEMRADVIAEACGSFHTPRVTVARYAISDSLAEIDRRSRAGMDAQS